MQRRPALAWDFRRGLSGWTLNADVLRAETTAQGLALTVRAPDSQLISPPLLQAIGPVAVVVVTMRSRGDLNGALYFGTTFTEADSRAFAVRNDGEHHVYRLVLPALPVGTRLRLDPTAAAGSVVVESVVVEAHPTAPHEPWAHPRELRTKKLIGAGQYTGEGGKDAVTTHYLAQHPEFLTRYPYDGMVLSVPVALPSGEELLQNWLWNTVPLTDAHLAPALAALKTVRWGHVTHNFLNVSMRDSADGKATPNLADDHDWATLENNIARAARLCRLAGLKGIWLDTEQYSNYAGSEAKFPLGHDTDAVLRMRGSQWIRAVQRELPSVQLIVTFAWSPDANGYGPLKGVTPFLDGILEGIQPPGAIHHGYENTFYYGQGPGTTYAASDGRREGYPGGRSRYELAAAGIRAWRAFSNNPKKYDQLVKTGMAAWIEDDPWNVWDGYPSGVPSSFWSNAALALAYSDEYVWVWSEHTHYAHGLAAKTGVNPFLAALSNQSFNTGKEAVASLAEDFVQDPLLHGWYFDCDWLAVGRKARPEHDVATMSVATLPYRWEPVHRRVVFHGERSVSLGLQRRRFVHPLRPLALTAPFEAELGFRIERFPAPGSPPLVLGLFASDRPADQGLCLEVLTPSRVRLGGVTCVLKRPLLAGVGYRLRLRGGGRTLDLSLQQAQQSLARVALTPAKKTTVDELGGALWDGPSRPGTSDPATPYRWYLESVRLRSSAQRQ